VSLYADACDVLARWSAPTSPQRVLQSAYVEHLRNHADGLSRHCHPDHITASTLVVSHDGRQVLLNLHRRYRIWVQFGGHCEDVDQRLHDAAVREAVEESGIDDLTLTDSEPVQLSRHEVVCGPTLPAHHLDVRYLAVAPPRARPRVGPESLDVRWFALNRLPGTLDQPLIALIRLTGSRWTARQG
jgi:8-oxo-dGTP pyrophosphatase MutT (NUDIX family)